MALLKEDTLDEVKKYAKDHEAALNYILKFGTAVQKAKAATLLEIVRGF